MPSGRPPLPRAASAPNAGLNNSPPLKNPGRNEQQRNEQRHDHQHEMNLFDAPADLICPISHEVYSDPVLNSAGQVYERSSIEQHLGRHNTDPITGTRLTSKVLTPVYFLKSRAAEFREAAARSSVERATAVGERDAVRYVRRAVELCDALSSPVPGLSQECLEYVKAHPSNVYDMPALHLFAKGLQESGQRDKAAAVYFTLLQAGADKAQQAGLLRQCLACWNMGAAGSDVGAQDTAMQDTVEMLVAFVEQSDGPSAAQIVDIAQEANLDHNFITTFCEYLLFRPGSRSDTGLSSTQWRNEKQMVVKYVQVSCSHIARQQEIADSRMLQVLQMQEEARWLQEIVPERQQNSSTPPGRKGSTEAKLAASVCLIASSLLQPEHTAVRVLRAVSVIALAHFSH